MISKPSVYNIIPVKQKGLGKSLAFTVTGCVSQENSVSEQSQDTGNSIVRGGFLTQNYQLNA